MPGERLVDYEREPVPLDKRRGWLEAAAIWAGIAACLAAVLFGGVMAYFFSLQEAILAMALGYIISTTICILCGFVGQKLGLSTAFVSRFAFGNVGSIVVSAILAIGCFGWFAVQLGFFSITASEAIRLLVGTPGDLVVLSIVGGALMILTAFYGYRAIGLLSIIAVPVMYALVLVVVVILMGAHPWDVVATKPPLVQKLPLGTGVSLAAATYMVGAVIAPDIYRYAKNKRHVIGASILGFYLATLFMMAAGVYMTFAVLTPEEAGKIGIIEVMIRLGLGLPALALLILMQWTTNDNNLYSSALALSNIIRSPKWPKWRLTLIAGILGIIIGIWMILAGFLGAFISWLSILAALIPGIAGVYLTDYLINKQDYSWEKLSTLKSVKYPQFSAWILGSFIGFCTTSPPTGLGWFSLTTVPALDSILVATIANVIFQLLYKKVRRTLIS
jgi:cytosine permease